MPVHFDRFDVAGPGKVVVVVAAAAEGEIGLRRIDDPGEGGIGLKGERGVGGQTPVFESGGLGIGVDHSIAPNRRRRRRDIELQTGSRRDVNVIAGADIERVSYIKCYLPAGHIHLAGQAAQLVLVVQQAV